LEEVKRLENSVLKGRVDKEFLTSKVIKKEEEMPYGNNEDENK
jgi:hypothetical protein